MNNDKEFIDKQLKFMYGNYYDNVINNNNIYKPKSEYDLSIYELINNIDFKGGLKGDIKDNADNRTDRFIQLLRKHWHKESNEYIIEFDWNDNVEYNKFILAFNRKYNTFNQVIFPLHPYNGISDMKIEDNIHFKDKQNTLFWRGSST